MANSIILTTPDELTELVRQAVRQELSGSRTQSSQNEKEILTIDEVAKLLGRTKQAIYTLVNKRQIPFAKPDGRLIFKRSQIMAWIDNSCRTTTDEVKEAVRNGQSFTSKSRKL